ncbi:MAG TPA: hypothetical protein VFJ94_12760 [Intrasporangium sp.]|uniref:hypothetical protein n=1 Tax=Intrasporangium sp. TaxID=1925024 RepID=UPI002D772FFB|nr:hypothetical protein [Intrasporangium sp.]HET7399382.1 hypothetical protein [Intrasporangium sp.]
MDHPRPQALAAAEPTGFGATDPATTAPAKPLIALDNGWVVVAMDEVAAELSATKDAYVYAVDSEQLGIASYDDLRALEHRESAISVRPFRLSELPPQVREACVHTFGPSISAGGL